MSTDDVIAMMKEEMVRQGYRHEVEYTATEVVERWVRPDGIVALTATKPRLPYGTWWVAK